MGWGCVRLGVDGIRWDGRDKKGRVVMGEERLSMVMLCCVVVLG